MENEPVKICYEVLTLILSTKSSKFVKPKKPNNAIMTAAMIQLSTWINFQAFYESDNALKEGLSDIFFCSRFHFQKAP